MADRKEVEKKINEGYEKANRGGPTNKSDRDSGNFVSFDKPVPTEKPKKG